MRAKRATVALRLRSNALVKAEGCARSFEARRCGFRSLGTVREWKRAKHLKHDSRAVDARCERCACTRAARCKRKLQLPLPASHNHVPPSGALDEDKRKAA